MQRAQGTKALTAAGKIVAVAGDIPGYTKLNQYRTSGDIGEFTWASPIGVAKAGFWYEHSQSKRYRYDYDFTQAAANNAFGDYHFNFAAMANYFNYKEKLVNGVGQPTLELGGAPVPQYIKYDERTSWDQIQGFGEFEFHLFDDRLKLTPGVKVQNFTRSIATPIAAQSSREGIVDHQTYRPTLPYFTANFLVTPNLSTYFQFAKGFLIPSLSGSLETSSTAGTQTPLDPPPTKTTNYQAGAVFAGDSLNVDGDVYYIKTSNSSFVDPANPGVVVVSTGPATYKGVEGQVSYRLPFGLTAIVNGSLASAKDDNSGTWLVQAPDYTALAGAVYGHGPIKLSYLHKFVGRQYWYVDPAKVKPSVRAAPYSLGIVSGSYQIGPVPARRDGLQRVRRPLDDVDRRGRRAGRGALHLPVASQRRGLGAAAVLGHPVRRAGGIHVTPPDRGSPLSRRRRSAKGGHDAPARRSCPARRLAGGRRQRPWS